MNVFNWMLNHWGFCTFVLALFVQFTPVIKFNPFTALFQWIGKIIVADVRRDVTDIRQAIAEMQTQQDENEKDRIRWEILDFANSCRNARRHTKDEYQHVIELHDKYKALLEKTHDANGVFDAEYEYILGLYRERQERNDFL